jgi:hypothetical protein
MTLSVCKEHLPIRHSKQTIKKYFSQLSKTEQDTILDFMNELEQLNLGPMSLNHIFHHISENCYEGAGLADIFRKVMSIFQRAREPVIRTFMHSKDVAKRFKQAYQDSKEDLQKAKQAATETFHIVKEELAKPNSDSVAASEIQSRLSESIPEIVDTEQTTSGGYRMKSAKRKGFKVAGSGIVDRREIMDGKIKKGGFASGGSAVYDS